MFTPLYLSNIEIGGCWIDEILDAVSGITTMHVYGEQYIRARPIESGGAQNITGKPHVICRTVHLYRLVTRRLVIGTRSSGHRHPYLSAMAQGCASRS